MCPGFHRPTSGRGLGLLLCDPCICISCVMGLPFVSQPPCSTAPPSRQMPQSSDISLRAATCPPAAPSSLQWTGSAGAFQYGAWTAPPPAAAALSPVPLLRGRSLPTLSGRLGLKSHPSFLPVLASTLSSESGCFCERTSAQFPSATLTLLSDLPSLAAGPRLPCPVSPFYAMGHPSHWWPSTSLL